MAENEFENYSVFGLKPFYTFKRNTWDLKLGLKAFFAIDHGQAVNITPDIHGKIALVDKIFYLYGGITGDYKINSMRTIFDENQYARPDIQPENTYTPFDAYAGLKIKLFDYMVLNGFAGYKYIANQHFFINSRIADAYYGNTFDIINDKTGLFNVGASLTYNYKKSLSLLLKGVYNQWSPKTQEFAWHKPAWELDFNIDYKVIEDLKLTANFFVLGKRKALGFANETVELKPIFDLNLSATYEFASWIAFYVNFNNIFAQNYQLWYGYNSQRFNAMAGAVFSF